MKRLSSSSSRVSREVDNRGWDGWMASLTQWTWVWVSSENWWWTGRPGVLQSMGCKESDTTEQLNWLTELNRAPGRSQPPTTVSAETTQGAVMRAPNPSLLGRCQQSPREKPKLLPLRKETSLSQPSGECPLPPANHEAAFTLQLKIYQRKPAVRELNKSPSFLTVPKLSISPSKFIFHTKKCKISTLMRNDNKRHKQWDDTDVRTIWQGF